MIVSFQGYMEDGMSLSAAYLALAAREETGRKIVSGNFMAGKDYEYLTEEKILELIEYGFRT